MNTRQLSQGLKPTLEFERMHTFKSFRQFPELRKSVEEIENIKFRSSDPHFHLKSDVFKRKKLHTTTHHLSELSQSSLTELSSVMDDFRRILMENRRKNSVGGRPVSPKDSSQSLTLSPTVPILRSRSPSPSSSPHPQSVDPLHRANEKLKKVSVSFDAGSYNSHLAGFQGAKLTKKEFSTLLRRCLNIHLNTRELDALFLTMDSDCSGLIDGVEFIRYFFHLGNEAKAKMQQETRERHHRRLEAQKQLKAKREAQAKAWEASQISGFSDSDKESVQQKLAVAALHYDPTRDIDHSLIHQLRGYATPYDFQNMVVKCFHAMGLQLHFTGPELAALIDKFSTHPGERCVDGYAFVTAFVHRAQQSWQEHAEKQKPWQRRRQRVQEMGQHVDIMPKSLGR